MLLLRIGGTNDFSIFAKSTGPSVKRIGNCAVVLNAGMLRRAQCNIFPIADEETNS
jgi:hypothetical protein